MVEIRTLPLTPERWMDFETLFGRSGACYGCWCTYFRLPAADRNSLNGAAKKQLIRARIVDGPPPGIIGYIGERPMAWVQVCPRPELPRWNSERSVSRPLDPADAADRSVWAISCFFMTATDRGRGHSHLMLSAAVDYAAASGARLIEACPIERTKQSKSLGLYVGSARIFEAAGFVEVARRKDGRPLMRLTLKGVAG